MKNDQAIWSHRVMWVVWPDGYITIQSLAIYNNDNLPFGIKMPKLEQMFGKYLISYPEIAQIV